jgi:hypothetical protein
MTRWDKLKDWPASLERMSVDELRKELAYWRAREREPGHRQKKKDAMNHARAVESLLDRRLDEQAASDERAV